jgi:hypothetical protein
MNIADPNLRSCERCGGPFEPRSGSGGSAQRFCCTECRLGFHKERLRCQRKDLYAGRSLRARSVMNDGSGGEIIGPYCGGVSKGKRQSERPKRGDRARASCP